MRKSHTGRKIGTTERAGRDAAGREEQLIDLVPVRIVNFDLSTATQGTPDIAVGINCQPIRQTGSL